MALPNDLTPLDIAYGGVVFCWTLAKPDMDAFSMDLVYGGMPYVVNAAISSASAPPENGLDLVYAGMPFVREVYDTVLIDLSTLDYADAASPYTTNPVGSDRNLYAGVQQIRITNPSAGINGLLRKYPLVRNEFVASNNESAHVFPYATIQDPALIP